MNNTQEQLPTLLQRSGSSPRSSTKRNSGLFAFFKWFKPSTSKESIDSESPTGSLESLGSNKSIKSAGTVASFNFVPPNAYENRVTVEKCVQIGPETDTYKARLKQRDKRREYDKNLTLRKKYNLFFNRDTFLRPQSKLLDDPENSRSLPLMTRAEVMEVDPAKVHRRTNSESSKVRKAGAYLHVKGKRKAPQPPGIKENSADQPSEASSTTSLKKKKRLAPVPPNLESQQPSKEDILSNDSWKLDHGVLKPAKENSVQNNLTQKSEKIEGLNPLSPSSSRSSFVEAPVSPRPWYKRQSSNLQSTKTESKNEEKLPEVQYMRNSSLDLTLEDALTDSNKKKDEKRKSGMAFLTNISELDREASEVIKSKKQDKPAPLNNNLNEIPEFMKPPENKVNIVQESLATPKKRTSARDLIAKFNAITGVSKSTVFGAHSNRDRYFGKQHSLEETRRQENLLDAHKKRIEDIDKKKQEKLLPLMKSESASAVKLNSNTKETKLDIHKSEKASWKCPKCNLDNEYWRIICHVCSAIKPYFDEFAPATKIDVKPLETKTESPVVLRRELTPNNAEKWFERSKTQIGFSALANYKANNERKLQRQDDDSDKSKVDDTSKKEEREKLKKMLIEMKNSLPKRKSNILIKQNSRSSIILENPEVTEENNIIQTTEPLYETFNNKPNESKLVNNEVKNTNKEIFANDTNNEKTEDGVNTEKTQEQKVISVLIGTTQTIYEHIKVKKSDDLNLNKVSSSAQTSAAAVKKIVPECTIRKLIEDHKNTNIYEPMKVKDFEDIYSDKNGTSPANIYANLAKKDELSLFFNVPKSITHLKINENNAKPSNSTKLNTDTIEINRLLRRLETSIAKGDMIQAAIFAKELAQLKVNCSVIRQKSLNDGAECGTKGFQIEMYVEDKVSHRGPFPIDVTENQTVFELKKQIFRDFEIPTEVQKWILGRELVTDEKKTLKEHHITAGCPVFLYLVAPEKSETSSKTATNSSSTSANKILDTVGFTKSEENKTTASSIPKVLQVTTKTEQNQLNVNKLQLVASKEVKPQIINVQPTIRYESKIEPKIISVIPKSSEPKITKVYIDKEVNNLDNELKNKQSRNLSIEDTKKIISKFTSTPSVSTTKIKIDVIPVVRQKTKLEAKKVNLDDYFLKVNKIDVKRNIDPTRSKEFRSNSVDLNKKFKNSSITSEITKLDTKIVETNVYSSRIPTRSLSAPSSIPQPSKLLEKPPEKEAPKAQAEDVTEFDPETPRLTTEWECHLCTLFNPLSSNICAVCATVRLNKSPRNSSKKQKAPQIPQQTYQMLVNLDSADLVTNTEPFECAVCFMNVQKGEGVVLRECLHQFCRECLGKTVEFAEEAEVKCPYRDENYSCNIAIQDREIKSFVSAAVYEQHLAKSVAQAENRIDKSFHCKTPDCKGWCIFEDNVNDFRCPVCRKTNCLTCQAIHMGVNCKEYQERIKCESALDEDAKQTREMLEEMVEKGEAIACPTCKVILMKKWGCDWLRCSMCKTEICWVTRGPRWGPAGKGDTSGGCKCGEKGVKCHPQCNYCH